ncbi:CCHC-type domain-containing protein [Mycena venus]|uniref:CCHC-type domain-containing protein n=1 Tax=Mycena venus TaxID=2733690 RepID=A0A8H6Y7P3_9AGAR|nr:CCHC-type domain-containing protein [Mycena venus]
MVTVDLRRKLQDERCADGGDVKAHLTKLQTIREDLIAMGADPGDKEFVAIVLGSLPNSWETYLSALTGAASLLGQSLDPDTVLQGIKAAFYGNSGNKGPKKNMQCFNCKKKGHMARDCWAKGGGKEDQNPYRKPKDRAHTAKAEKEFDAAWTATGWPEDFVEFDELDEEEDEFNCASNDEYADMPPLMDVSDTDEEADSDSDEDPEL